MSWNLLSYFLYRHIHKVHTVRGDGFCFLNAIGMVLYCDYDEIVIIDDIVNIILGYLAANVNYYKGFQTGDI